MSPISIWRAYALVWKKSRRRRVAARCIQNGWKISFPCTSKLETSLEPLIQSATSHPMLRLTVRSAVSKCAHATRVCASRNRAADITRNDMRGGTDGGPDAKKGSRDETRLPLTNKGE